MVRVINEPADAKARAFFLEDWNRPESEIRVLINSPIDDDELVAPNVENLVVFELEHTYRWSPRWQKMARMPGQKGIFLTISPTEELLVHYHFGKIPPELSPEAWRPTAWKEDKHRIFENLKLFKQLPDVPGFTLTLDHFLRCYLQKRGILQ